MFFGDGQRPAKFLPRDEDSASQSNDEGDARDEAKLSGAKLGQQRRDGSTCAWLSGESAAGNTPQAKVASQW